MKVYILKHPKSDFSEHLYGITFDKGIGSTCSQRDAHFCVQKGCKDVTDDYEAQVNEKTGVIENYVLKKKKGKKAPAENEAPAKKGK